MAEYFRIIEIPIQRTRKGLSVGRRNTVRVKKDDIVVFKFNAPFSIEFTGPKGSPDKRARKKLASDRAHEIRLQMRGPVGVPNNESSEHPYDIVTFDATYDPRIVIDPG